MTVLISKFERLNDKFVETGEHIIMIKHHALLTSFTHILEKSLIYVGRRCFVTYFSGFVLLMHLTTVSMLHN